MLADERARRRFRVDRRLRVHRGGAAACRARPRSCRGSTPATRSRSTIRSPPRASPPRKSSSGAMPASTTSCRACSRAARSRSSRSAARTTDEPFNSEDLALLTAVAGQVATAIENGRLYRQLHLKAEELGRMREFNDNILESLDDGLVVFDAGRADRPLEPRARGLLRRRRATTRSDGRSARSSTSRSSRRSRAARGRTRTAPRSIACR